MQYEDNQFEEYELRVPFNDIALDELRDGGLNDDMHRGSGPNNGVEDGVGLNEVDIGCCDPNEEPRERIGKGEGEN